MARHFHKDKRKFKCVKSIGKHFSFCLWKSWIWICDWLWRLMPHGHEDMISICFLHTEWIWGGGGGCIRNCPISSPAEGLIYVFCWHHLTGTLVLRMGTGDVVRIICLQVTLCQNDVTGAGSEDYEYRQELGGKKGFCGCSTPFPSAERKITLSASEEKHFCSKTNDNSIILNALKVSLSCRTQLQW